MDNKERLEITSIEEWRFWLEEHYGRDEGVWLVTFKKHCGDRYVDYDTAVSEALCFGWVDSHTRRVDDDRTRLYFSPRRPGSPWSASNKARVKRLLEEDRMMEAGLKKIRAAKRDGSWTAYDDIEKGIEPPDLQKALKNRPGARKHWDAFPRQARKNLLWWIKSAKKPETRSRRIDKVAEQAAKGLMANHPNG